MLDLIKEESAFTSKLSLLLSSNAVLSNWDTLGTEESILLNEVSSFQVITRYYSVHGKVDHTLDV